MIFGAAYYPEFWPEERWKIDVELMLKAGINTVRMGEFAWCRMEPKEGEYDFSWLERAARLMVSNGIEVILGTPTSSPTAWLAKKYPEILPKDEKGIVKRFGSRKNYCVNSPVYRGYSAHIVRKMAEHFKDFSGIHSWQIDNEFGNRGSGTCYCENCAREFRIWLKEKYKTLENLNKCWGAVFWSHEYSDWEEIEPPLYSVTTPDPGIRLDYQRFCSDSFVNYQRQQVEIIKEVIPEAKVTHNLMSSFYGIDYFKLSQDLDFASFDIYPNFGADPAIISMKLDSIRGYKGGRNFLVAEQQCGQKIWAPVNTVLRPGVMRLWTYDSIAHGANGVMYFSWRSPRFGSEKFHSGLLTHDGIGDNRIFKEASQIGGELKKIGEKITGALPKSKIAMVFSFDSKWALDAPPSPTIYLDYSNTFFKIYKELHELNMQVDIVEPSSDLSGYTMVVAPLLYIVTEELRDKLYEFVKGGGTLISTMQSGLVDENDIVTEKPYPGELAELFGIRVLEYDVLNENMSNTVIIKSGPLKNNLYDVEIWCDLIEPRGASVVASYEHDFYKGLAAITCNSYGKGKAYYVGTLCKGGFFKDILEVICSEAGLSEPMKAADGVMVKRVYKEGREYIYLLNHNDTASKVTLDGKYTDILTCVSLEDTISINAYGLLILEKPLD